MGSVQSKGETGDNHETNILPLLCKFMSERYPGSLNQIQKWVELGFPSKGSLSENQLEQLELQLREKEKNDAAQHAGLSGRKQKKNVVCKADWEAFKMWKYESERRERQRLVAFNSLKTEDPTKSFEMCTPSNPKTLYPCFYEFLRRLVDTDLDSPPPLTATPAPAFTSSQSPQQEAAQANLPRFDNSPPGGKPDSTSNTSQTTFSPTMTRSQAQQRRALLRGKQEALSDPEASFPMVEVAGAQGTMLVFRPWSDTDEAEAMSHVCNPKDNLAKWETDLKQFVREYRPTMSELRRLMCRLLKHDYHRVQGVFTTTRMAAHLKDPDYENDTNAAFRNAVDALVVMVKEQFPLRLNLSTITSMIQGPQETCSSFLARLTTAFDTHSGLNRPDPMGAQPLMPYEVHLKEHFISRMRPELKRMVKRSCATGKTCALTDILQHAEHAEDELHKKEDKLKGFEKAQYAMFTCLQCQHFAQGQHGRGRGYGRARGRGRSDRTYGNYDPNVCYNCGQQGHWRAQCPEHMRMRHITRLTEGGRGRGGPQRRSTPPR
ncbi:uncharacterized protein LOC144390929 [Gasterosteus aculeatus]